MKKILITLTLSSGLFLSGLTGANDDFNAAWEAADNKRKEAAAVGYEWRDTKKILKKAKQEAEGGNQDKAMKLVARALEESEDAIAQQAREMNLWQARVPQ